MYAYPHSRTLKTDPRPPAYLHNFQTTNILMYNPCLLTILTRKPLDLTLRRKKITIRNVVISSIEGIATPKHENYQHWHTAAPGKAGCINVYRIHINFCAEIFIFGGQKSFLWGPIMSLFLGLLVFWATVNSWLACFVACTRWIPQIHLWVPDLPNSWYSFQQCYLSGRVL